MNEILITTSNFDSELINHIENSGFQVILNPYKRKLTEMEVTELIEKYQPVGMIAGVEPLTRDVFKITKNLKVISRCGIGLDSVDLDAARDFGIAVTNTPDAPTIPVAELTLGMILTLLRRIHISDMGIRNDSWERPMGTLIHGKVIGIIGCGRIGSYLAKIMSVFGCRVLGYDLLSAKNGYLTYVPLDQLLSESDIVTLHIPYSKESHHFINNERLSRMKEGAVVVNSARGGLIDEDALYKVLKSGHIGGAALDCFETEPYNGPLKELDNVLLTAHIGSYAREGRIIMERQSVENLLCELKKLEVIK